MPMIRLSRRIIYTTSAFTLEGECLTLHALGWKGYYSVLSIIQIFSDAFSEASKMNQIDQWSNKTK